jgi:transposase
MRDMGMGKRTRHRDATMWVATSDLPTAPSHPFYRRLNRLSQEHNFDPFVEGLCACFYATRLGRPSVAPGIYFRLLLVGSRRRT